MRVKATGQDPIGVGVDSTFAGHRWLRNPAQVTASGGVAASAASDGNTGVSLSPV